MRINGKCNSPHAKRNIIVWSVRVDNPRASVSGLSPLVECRPIAEGSVSDNAFLFVCFFS